MSIGFTATFFIGIVMVIRRRGGAWRYFKWAIGLFVALIIVAQFSPEQVEEATKEKKVPEETKATPTKTPSTAKTEKSEIVSKDKTKESDESGIDTNVFEYAEKVEVTNAIELNDHVTIFVFMNEEVKPGLAVQHVVNQTYDFIQQKDMTNAKTISVNVKQGDLKTAMFTVHTEKFVPDDDEPMSDAVMKASDFEFMNGEVKEYGEIMGTW